MLRHTESGRYNRVYHREQQPGDIFATVSAANNFNFTANSSNPQLHCFFSSSRFCASSACCSTGRCGAPWCCGGAGGLENWRIDTISHKSILDMRLDSTSGHRPIRTAERHLAQPFAHRFQLWLYGFVRLSCYNSANIVHHGAGNGHIAISSCRSSHKLRTVHGIPA